MRFPNNYLLNKNVPSDQDIQFESLIKENNLPAAYEFAIDNPKKDRWYQLKKLANKNKNMNMGQNCHLHYIGYITGT